MTNSSDSMAGGLCVLAALVVLLAIPPVFGYFVKAHTPALTVHADASQ